MDGLADEIIIHELFGNLEVRDILNYCLVNSNQRHLCNSDELWKYLLERDFYWSVYSTFLPKFWQTINFRTIYQALYPYRHILVLPEKDLDNTLKVFGYTHVKDVYLYLTPIRYNFLTVSTDYSWTAMIYMALEGQGNMYKEILPKELFTYLKYSPYERCMIKLKPLRQIMELLYGEKSFISYISRQNLEDKNKHIILKVTEPDTDVIEYITSMMYWVTSNLNVCHLPKYLHVTLQEGKIFLSIKGKMVKIIDPTIYKIVNILYDNFGTPGNDFVFTGLQKINDNTYTV